MRKRFSNLYLEYGVKYSFLWTLEENLWLHWHILFSGHEVKGGIKIETNKGFQHKHHTLVNRTKVVCREGAHI